MGNINSGRALTTLEDITIYNITEKITFMGKKVTYLGPVIVPGVKSMIFQEQTVVAYMFKKNTMSAPPGGYFKK